MGAVLAAPAAGPSGDLDIDPDVGLEITFDAHPDTDTNCVTDCDTGLKSGFDAEPRWWR